MNNFIFQNATKVYFGKGCVKEYLAYLTKDAKTILLAYGGGSIKKNGVYVDLNLHVSYSYWQGKDYAKDGLKDNAARDRFLPTFGKGIDRIEDDFIEQQKDYARRLLGHKNPYTGLGTQRSYSKRPLYVH